MVVRKSFEDIESVVDEALDIDCDYGVSFITKYENTTIILKELLGYAELMPILIDVSDPLFDGYDKEFIISVTDNGEVFCEKLFRNNGYLHPTDGVIYIFDDCDDECLSHFYGYNCFLVNVNIDNGVESCCCSDSDIYKRAIKDESGAVIGYVCISELGNLGRSATFIFGG